MKQKVLFIDRDGTMIIEPDITFQVDTLDQLELLPGLIRNLYRIQELGYELVMVTNQDGLGTPAYPRENFDIIQTKLLQLLANEDILFKAIHIDVSFEHEHKKTRKPGLGMLQEYLNSNYDLPRSYVIGDRRTDAQLASNLGSGMILINNKEATSQWTEHLNWHAKNWDEIYNQLRKNNRLITAERNTNETKIKISLNPDGIGDYEINTGLGFFDHMLEQLAKHSNTDMQIVTHGDLHIDEHHTIEDTALALGEAFSKVLGDKKGINRYGFTLPMDDCLAQVAIDFGGRPWLVWEADFSRPYIGDMPTELFFHFFKSFSDAARCNLNIKAEGTNEHHKIEAIFKAFAKAIKMAIQVNDKDGSIPTTKGIL